MGNSDLKKLEHIALLNMWKIKKQKISEDQLIEEIDAIFRLFNESYGLCEYCDDYLGLDSLDQCSCDS